MNFLVVLWVLMLSIVGCCIGHKIAVERWRWPKIFLVVGCLTALSGGGSWLIKHAFEPSPKTVEAER